MLGAGREYTTRNTWTYRYRQTDSIHTGTSIFYNIQNPVGAFPEIPNFFFRRNFVISENYFREFAGSAIYLISETERVRLLCVSARDIKVPVK